MFPHTFGKFLLLFTLPRKTRGGDDVIEKLHTCRLQIQKMHKNRSLLADIQAGSRSPSKHLSYPDNLDIENYDVLCFSAGGKSQWKCTQRDKNYVKSNDTFYCLLSS